MSSEYESYRRRAEENLRWANECKQKMGWKPQSANTYKRLHDEALAEMCLNDAMARANSGNGSTPQRELLDLRERNAAGINMGPFDKEVFRDALDRMIDSRLAADQASDA